MFSLRYQLNMKRSPWASNSPERCPNMPQYYHPYTMSNAMIEPKSERFRLEFTCKCWNATFGADCLYWNSPPDIGNPYDALRLAHAASDPVMIRLLVGSPDLPTEVICLIYDYCLWFPLILAKLEDLRQPSYKYGCCVVEEV